MAEEPSFIVAIVAAVLNAGLFFVALFYLIIGDSTNNHHHCSSLAVVIPIYLMILSFIGVVAESKATDRVWSVRTKLFSQVNMLSLVYGRAVLYAALGFLGLFFHPRLYCSGYGNFDTTFFIPFLICGVGHLIMCGIYIIMGVTKKGIEGSNQL